MVDLCMIVVEELCDRCGIDPTQGLEQCAGCGRWVCAICRVMRFSVLVDMPTMHRYCKECDPNGKSQGD